MRIRWREQLEMNPNLRDISSWPEIPAAGIPKKYRKAFLRNKSIVAQVLAGDSLKVVATRNHVSQGRVSQLLARCLGSDNNEPPRLTEALIPHRIVIDKRRQRELPTLEHPAGATFAFQALLDQVSGLKDTLDKFILAALDDKPYSQRLTPKNFHAEFKHYLRVMQWPTNRYPYTTESMAYESLRQYLTQRTLTLTRTKQENRVKNQGNTLSHSHRRVYRALRAIQIDEHLLDLGSRIHLVLNNELIPLRIGRVSVLVAIDVDTSCVLGFWVAQTASPNQQDMLSLLHNCVSPWKPMKLQTPGFVYEPGACFPSAKSLGHPISFGCVHMDNAWIHSAGSVQSFLTQDMGATIALGLPANPKVRALIESIFDYINESFSHRLDSTTGSHPHDPKRESSKNAKKPPLITFRTVLEALSIVLTGHNLRSRKELGGNHPLALFQHHISDSFVRFVPKIIRQEWSPFFDEKKVTLHWYRHENRAPFVNFEGLRYSGPGLINIADKAKQIRVVFNRQDLRILHAFSTNGKDLGKLDAPRSWQRFPHSLATRRTINKLIKSGRLRKQDPLADFCHLLLEARGKPSVALSLLKIVTEFTGGKDTPLFLKAESGAKPSPGYSLAASQSWNPDMANYRR